MELNRERRSKMNINSHRIAEAIELKGKNGVWDIYIQAEIGSPLKEEAASEYLNLCTKPHEIWKIYSHVDLDEKTKKLAQLKLVQYEQARVERPNRVFA
jgi:hypothetical protein